MLSQEDLNQIRNIVVESEVRIKTELRTEFRKELRRETNKIWKELRFLREALNSTIAHFEREIIAIKKHVKMVD